MKTLQTYLQRSYIFTEDRFGHGLHGHLSLPRAGEHSLSVTAELGGGGACLS